MGETPRGILNVTVPLNDKWYFSTGCIELYVVCGIYDVCGF